MRGGEPAARWRSDPPRCTSSVRSSSIEIIGLPPGENLRRSLSVPSAAPLEPSARRGPIRRREAELRRRPAEEGVARVGGERAEELLRRLVAPAEARERRDVIGDRLRIVRARLER